MFIVSEGFNEILERYHTAKVVEDGLGDICTKKFGIGENPTPKELIDWGKSQEAFNDVCAELREYVI